MRNVFILLLLFILKPVAARDSIPKPLMLHEKLNPKIVKNVFKLRIFGYFCTDIVCGY